MEAGTGTVSTTESTTIAGLAAAAFEKYADRPAVKFKTAEQVGPVGEGKSGEAQAAVLLMRAPQQG